ncbi:WXG100 family type VII secretion target [Agromyces mediolanus]|uniref:WXG100 family type VII secretion target n=1 Tax=Agromyces mediolanus TaxID=41986 RepID=UPI001E4CE796|nr:WXG100 family type VII secretion target [Agromyces mediolanus]MCD1571127.1 WXG100 family type VII secretion target [Agromyces mediolanus]
MTSYAVDSGQVLGATQVVQGTIDRLQGEVGALMGQLAGLQSVWSGAASAAFQGAVADWRATQQQVETNLGALRQALALAGTAYAEAEQANTRLFLR